MLAAVLIVVALAGRWLFTPDPPTPSFSLITTDYLVVVGVETRTEPTPADRAILDAAPAQVGMLRVPTAADQCAAAGFASLGAREVVDTGSICHPEVTVDGAIADWQQLQAGAGGRLGALADLSDTCVAAVGPEAALAAARSDGTVSVYQSPEEFAAAGHLPSCPLTFVSAPTSAAADDMITALAGMPDVTLIVAGLGPDRDGTRPQLYYRTNTTLPGLAIGRDRHVGELGLTDLSSALLAYRQDPTASYPVDETGMPLQVIERETSADVAATVLRDARNLADRSGFVLPGVAAVLIGALLWALARFGPLRRFPPLRPVLAAVLAGWPGALSLTGLLGWWRTDAPVLMALLGAGAFFVALTSVSLGLSRWWRWPAWLTGAAVAALVGFGHAWLGNPWSTGTLLDPGGWPAGPAAVTVSCVLVVATFRWGRGWFWGAHTVRAGSIPWLTLIVAALGVALVFVRLPSGSGWTDHLMIVAGLGAWTLVHAWLAPGRVDGEPDLAGLRIPVLLVVCAAVLLSAAPASTWLAGSLTFASLAAAWQLSREPAATTSAG